MPFKSKAQQRMMFAQRPEMAQEMASKMEPGEMKRLPEYVGKGKKKKKKGRVPAYAEGSHMMPNGERMMGKMMGGM